MSAVEDCRRWVDEVVVGLGLCPWAAGPLAGGLVRFVEVEGADAEGVVHAVLDESQRLCQGPAEASTLVVLEGPGPDFEELLGLVHVGEQVLDAVGLAEDVQLVAFHPAFRYDGAEPDDPANGTNRSPAPMIHLLQRADLDAVRADGAAVAQRNATVLRARAAASQGGDGVGYTEG